MTELKLDSRSIDSIQLSTYEAVCRIAVACEVPFVIVGASARDLVMHHGYGAAIQRATRDVDIAIQVSDWSAFDTMRDNLTKERRLFENRRSSSICLASTILSGHPNCRQTLP